MRHFAKTLARHWLLSALLVGLGVPAPLAYAQEYLPNSAATEKTASQNAVIPQTDLYGRETPRSLASGLVGAFASVNYERASHYFEAAPQSKRKKASQENRAVLAQRLHQLLDSNGSLLPFASLSSESAGALNDGLPPEQERIGTIRTDAGEQALIAQRITPIGGSPYWVVSNASLQSLPEEVQDPNTSTINSILPAALTEIRIAGAPVADWLILSAVAIVAFLGMRFIFAIVLRLFHFLVKHPESHRGYQFAAAAFPPLSLYLAVILFFFGTHELQVAIVARQVLARYATIVAWVAFVWLLWRLIDMVSALWSARMARTDRRQAMSALVFVRRSAKSVLSLTAFVAVLDTLNIDVTTGVAALGLGGLAIALGAQKAIENLVGSLAVIVDQPVRVGDFCKVGDVTGTVEDIGMRSTRVRTNARTVVTIPNGNFSSQQIENYSRRDRFLLNPTIGLTYDTTAVQMRAVLKAIRSLLIGNESVDHDARVRFVEFNDSALDIEIFAYVHAVDYAEFLGKREDILLQLMDTIADAGCSIAFPTQTLVLKSARNASPRAGENE